MRALVLLASGLSTLLVQHFARAGDAEEFGRARSRFEAGDYPDAAARLRRLLDTALPACAGLDQGVESACHLTDPDVLERATATLVAALVAMGQKIEAAEHARAIFRRNPTFRASPANFPQGVVDLFADIQSEMRNELDALMRERADAERAQKLTELEKKRAHEARIRQLEVLASQETRVVENSRWIAAIPGGVGQFQNGHTGWGVAFASTEVLAASTSIVSAVVANYYASIDTRVTVTGDDGEAAQIDRGEVQQKFETARLVNFVSFGAFVALAMAGVIHAQVAFVPEERRVVPRPLNLAAAPGGLQLTF